MYYYNARYYDPALHKFIQADTIVPDPTDPQTLNRFSYTNNNPIKYTDPTGHIREDAESGGGYVGASGAVPLALSQRDLETLIIAGTTAMACLSMCDDVGQAVLTIDLAPPPDLSTHTVPDPTPLNLSTSTGIPAPVAPPFSNDYTSLAVPPLDLPNIMTVERLPVPAIPEGITRNQFGNDIMKWGRNDAEARARMETITAEEMVSQGVTLKMAIEWRDYYMNEVLRTPQNPSVRGRIDLMEYTSELLANWIAQQEGDASE